MSQLSWHTGSLAVLPGKVDLTATLQRMPRVIVIGAGAAGTMAAIFAARAGAQVVLLERTRDGGRKILISGGGRCNILPMKVDEARFVTDSSVNTLRKMVRAWPLAEQRAFFEDDLNIPLVEEAEELKLFPASNKARDVRDGLLVHARQKGVDIRMGTPVIGVAPEASGWRIDIENEPALTCDRLIIATGGLSVPNTGSDGFGLRTLEALGHTVNTTYAALTPILAEQATYASLAGVSLTVTLTATAGERAATHTGGFLFTHHGYSGPAALDVSHVVVRDRQDRGAGGAAGAREARDASAALDVSARARIRVQWTPLTDADWERAFAPRGARTVRGALRDAMPDRLAAVLMEVAQVDPYRSLSDMRREERLRLISVLVRGELPWSGDEGYKKAEVTGGGVALGEVNPRTMESRKHPGLFICGEVLDAFGPIGGYNFLWAWATGRAAGMGAGAP